MLVHLRRRLRRPLPFWSLAAAVALATGGLVAHLIGAADADAAAWGSRRRVLVAVHDVAAGQRLGADDAEVRLLPGALVPVGALDDQRVGAVVTEPLHAGEAVLSGRLAPAGVSATAALLPPGTRGVAVPDDEAGLAVRPGDLVDVLATLGGKDSGGPPTFPVARSAAVVAVADKSVTVAVSADDAARVAYAVATGTVALALVGPGG